MKTYIEYYTTGTDGSIIRALGSDGTMRVDGRLSYYNTVCEAVSAATSFPREHYVAFKIMKGESIGNMIPISKMIYLSSFIKGR